MAEKLTNITAPQYRCSLGACPAVYRSEDGKTFFIIGELARFTDHPELDANTDTENDEAAIKISADLVLSSLGVADLIEAAEQALEIINETGALVTDDDEFAALRSVLTRIQGGQHNG